MCTVLTHPVVPVTLSALFPRSTLSRNVIIAGALCSVVPDLDVVGFALGVSYHELLGHRGLTHSLFFAAALGALLTLTVFRGTGKRRAGIFLFLLLSTLSHPLLDALTNGGLGVALLAPFNDERYFFAWRPIEVSPIGLSRFISARGVEVILSELLWVWLPCAMLYIGGQTLRRRS